MSKRNHHKQPNFYLKGFKSSDEGKDKVWVYEKGKPFYDGKTEQLQNPKLLTTEKAARTRDFYTFENEDGRKEYDKYEDLLEQQFERPAIDVIEKIRRLEEIDETEKILLSRYVASMITRGDWWKSIYSNHIQPIDEEILRLEESENEKTLLVEKKHKESIFRVVENHYQKFLKLEWRFLKMPSKLKLITSDNPVVIFNDIRQKLGQVIFPVFSDVALSMTHEGFEEPRSWKKLIGNYREIDENTVETLRNDIVFVALKEVYYSQKAEWLVTFINNRIVK